MAVFNVHYTVSGREGSFVRTVEAPTPKAASAHVIRAHKECGVTAFVQKVKVASCAD